MSINKSTSLLPGRLGNPDSTLRADERVDPRLVNALAPYELDVHPEKAPVDGNSSAADCIAWSAEAEANYAGLFETIFVDLSTISNVESSEETITGIDGNEIKIYTHRPTNVQGKIPCLVHTHGGGMVILKAEDPNYERWRQELASRGLLVLGVEFRNGGGALGNHPFPAGLNDCASATRWAFKNRDELGVSSIIVSGESGGGNLCLATALKANRESWINEISGIYAQCPYISGVYADPPPNLPSLEENDDYFISNSMMAALVKVYDPLGENSLNPLAWPYHALEEDLAGLPPHVISVNELDPLRDEGLAYFRKLLSAGVPARGRTVLGNCHAGDCLFPKDLPDVYSSTINDIYGFCQSLIIDN